MAHDDPWHPGDRRHVARDHGRLVPARPAPRGVLARAGAGPGRAFVCRKEGSYTFYNFSGGFSWSLFGPDARLQYEIGGTLGNDSWGYIVGTYDKDAGRTTSVSI